MISCLYSDLNKIKTLICTFIPVYNNLHNLKKVKKLPMCIEQTKRLKCIIAKAKGVVNIFGCT